MRAIISKEEYERRIKNVEAIITVTLSTINDIISNYNNVKTFENPEKHKELIDTQLYLFHTQIDTLISMKNVERCVYEQNEFEEKYFARILILINYETLKKITQLLRESVLNEYRENSATLVIVQNIDEIKRELRTIRRSNRGWEDIRNNTIAHRGGNSLWQNKLMKDIDTDKLFTDSFDIALIYSRLANQLLGLNKALIKRQQM